MNVAPTRILLIAMLLACAFPALGAPDLSARLRNVVAASSPGDRLLLWVFFTDKGSHEFMKDAVPRSLVSPRSFRRRLLVRAPDRAVDSTDLPLEERYVREVAARVLRVRNLTKWFNAVSVDATVDQIPALEHLPFVRFLDLVGRYRVDRSREMPGAFGLQRTPPAPSPVVNADSLDYGPSYPQVQLINVPALHNMGNHAQGVIVGIFDNGFRLLNHQVFDSLHIIAMHDFVDHKVSVVPNDPDASFGAHGVATLSTLAGYRPGVLIGPAFGASFILARTENDSSETPIEEDNWLAAIEWADSIGVQVTSTSLGYLSFDPPYPSLTWRDMDGHTALITRAADMAVGKGIVVVNSAGNGGTGDSVNTLNAPADGDSVLAVGAVNPDGSRAAFSSRGPTVDGRIKPDVMAQGSSILAAIATDTAGYASGWAGTSFACPLAAGVAALLIRDFPNATPMRIDSALKMTASRALSPDNFYGWGIINALAAYQYLKSGDTGVVPPSTLPSTYTLGQNYPNPFNPFTTIEFGLPEPAEASLTVYDLFGREVRALVHGDFGSGTYAVRWYGNDNRGNPVASGMYFYRLEASGVNTGGRTVVVKRMVLVR